MLDIEIYLDVLEFIHTTAGGEGVQILFRILSGHSKGSELLVNAQFPHSLIAAWAGAYNWRKIKRSSLGISNTVFIGAVDIHAISVGIIS